MRKYIYICVCVEREYRRSAPMVWRRMLLLLETSGIEPITQTHTHPDILLEALKLIIFQYHCVRFFFSSSFPIESTEIGFVVHFLFGSRSALPARRQTATRQMPQLSDDARHRPSLQ